MKTLQKMVAGVALTGALLFGYTAKAQNVLVPTKVSTETSVIGNKDAAGVPMQRVEAGNAFWSFKYDIDAGVRPTDNPLNVGMFSLNKLYSKKNTSLGAEIFQVGKFKSDDICFVDAWVTQKIGDISVMIDAGKGFQKDKHSKDYVIATLVHPRFSLGGCAYKQGSFLEDHVKTLWYGYGAYKGNHIYAAVGNKISTTYTSFAVHSYKDFGTFAYGLFDRQTGNRKFKSQTAFGDVNQTFYSNATGEIVSNLYGMPAYFPKYFTQLSNKGTAAVKLEYTVNNGVTETEFEIASNKTPLVQLGVGLNTVYKEGSSKSSYILEVSKSMQFGNFSSTVETRYNNNKQELTAEVILSYTIVNKANKK
jgi:hypothetical protein